MEGALSMIVSSKVLLGGSRAWLTLANAPERLATSIDLIVTGETWSCVENDSSAFSQDGKKIGPRQGERTKSSPSAEPVPVCTPDSRAGV